MKLLDNQIPVMVGNEEDRTSCPTCGMPVRIVRRTNGYADHYEKIYAGEDIGAIIRGQDPETAKKLRKLRKGKKTVAFVGLAPTSCSLAPFDDLDVEIWGLNEAHVFPWMKRWDRWFQIHATESWKRYIAKRDVRGHFDWLRQEHVAEHDREWKRVSVWRRNQEPIPSDMGLWEYIKRRFGEKGHAKQLDKKKLKPIYMQYWHPLVPNSVGYPLHDVVAEFFKDFRRGDDKVKYFTSTFAYMAGIALMEKFERIEIYGFEMADEIEYVMQKACAEFWIGMALGNGVEVYTPPNCQILYSGLYGGNEQGEGW